MKKLWVIILAFMQFGQILAKEELVVIQAISSDRKSFVIRKGRIDGVIKGKESLFTNENVSIAATPVEVSRDNSLWKIKDLRGTVAFEKGEVVNYTNQIKNIYNEIPMLRFDPEALAEKAENEKIDEVVASFDRRQKILRANVSYTLAESISDTGAELDTQRNGIQFEFQYAWPIREMVDITAGIRLDQETASQETPTLDIPTQRILLVSEVLFQLDHFSGTINNLYLGIGAGYGRSQSEIDGTVSTGSAMVLPVVRLGYQKYLKSRYAFLVEGVAESITSKESFVDTKEQTTNMINFKFAVGLRF